MKEIKKDTNRKTSCEHDLEDLVLLKCSCFAKQCTDLMQILSNLNGIFCIYIKNNFKIHMESLRTQNSQINLEEEEQNWRHHTSLISKYNTKFQ